MSLDHEHFMRLAIEEGIKGRAEGNSAVGTVIVRGDTVVAVGRNLVTLNKRPHGPRRDRRAARSRSRVAVPGPIRLYPVYIISTVPHVLRRDHGERHRHAGYGKQARPRNQPVRPLHA